MPLLREHVTDVPENQRKGRQLQHEAKQNCIRFQSTLLPYGLLLWFLVIVFEFAHRPTEPLRSVHYPGVGLSTDDGSKPSGIQLTQVQAATAVRRVADLHCIGSFAQ